MFGLTSRLPVQIYIFPARYRICLQRPVSGLSTINKCTCRNCIYLLFLQSSTGVDEKRKLFILLAIKMKARAAVENAKQDPL